MKRSAHYTPAFYDFQSPGALQSARAILPLVIDLIQPTSVIDLGCGTGEFLFVFQQLGVQIVRGVDGDHVDRARLQIPIEFLTAHDLTKPFPIVERFDLVVSLEVAEHLPAQAAEQFIETVTGLGPVVLFGAAIPFQSGTGHINEQWPEYWAELFYRRGFVAYDCIRDTFWYHPGVSPWYAQNTFLYVREDVTAKYPKLSAPVRDLKYPSLAKVHHALWLQRVNPEYMGLRAALRAIPKVVARKFGGWF